MTGDMRTLRRGDGDMLFDEYSHQMLDPGDTDPWDSAYADAAVHFFAATDEWPEVNDPVEYVLETWQLVAVEVRQIRPSDARRRRDES